MAIINRSFPTVTNEKFQDFYHFVGYLVTNMVFSATILQDAEYQAALVTNIDLSAFNSTDTRFNLTTMSKVNFTPANMVGANRSLWGFDGCNRNQCDRS
jgi:uncharacterized protein YjbI with pentapeptide repeats